jgi:hypothetical protein
MIGRLKRGRSVKVRTIRAKLETASWLAWLALVGSLFSLSNMAPAQAQTWAPSFVLVVSGTSVSITSNQTFDYGATPPVDSVTHSPGVTVQLHNGPNPECLFSASSSAGDTQYVSIGGSNGYDSANHYRDPPPMALRLPVPMRWTLNLNCQSAGVVTAIVSTEVPQPSPACPCGPIPGGPLPVTPTPVAPVPPKAAPAPTRLAPKPVQKPVVPVPAPKPDPVQTLPPTPPTPPAVVQTTSPTPIPSPSPSLSPTPIPDHVSYDAGAKVLKSVAHHGGFPIWIFLVALIAAGGGCIFLFRRHRADSW